nr:hypothetical protein Itr_chr14CG07100 [Ipomoea trifida]
MALFPPSDTWGRQRLLVVKTKSLVDGQMCGWPIEVAWTEQQENERKKLSDQKFSTYYGKPELPAR